MNLGRSGVAENRQGSQRCSKESTAARPWSYMSSPQLFFSIEDFLLILMGLSRFFLPYSMVKCWCASNCQLASADRRVTEPNSKTFIGSKVSCAVHSCVPKQKIEDCPLKAALEDNAKEILPHIWEGCLLRKHVIDEEAMSTHSSILGEALVGTRLAWFQHVHAPHE